MFWLKKQISLLVLGNWLSIYQIVKEALNPWVGLTSSCSSFPHSYFNDVCFACTFGLALSDFADQDFLGKLLDPLSWRKMHQSSIHTFQIRQVYDFVGPNNIKQALHFATKKMISLMLNVTPTNLTTFN